MIQNDSELKGDLCPCGSKKSYISCCEPYLSGDALPSTPEQLMRSRYTAYTKGYIDYVFATMRDSALKNSDREASRQWSKTSKWLGLEVLSCETISDAEATVMFRVEFQQNNKTQILNEKAVFKKYEQKWYYVGNIALNEHHEEIKQASSNKVGRNDACPCGSGKKFKKCCV